MMEMSMARTTVGERALWRDIELAIAAHVMGLSKEERGNGERLVAMLAHIAGTIIAPTAVQDKERIITLLLENFKLGVVEGLSQYAEMRAAKDKGPLQ